MFQGVARAIQREISGAYRGRCTEFQRLSKAFHWTSEGFNNIVRARGAISNILRTFHGGFKCVSGEILEPLKRIPRDFRSITNSLRSFQRHLKGVMKDSGPFQKVSKIFQEEYQSLRPHGTPLKPSEALLKPLVYLLETSWKTPEAP